MPASKKQPSRMRAVVIRDKKLHLAECAVPKPKKGEVLIHVAASGVNRPDILQRQGLYPPPKGASDIPGLEVAGQIIGVGAGVAKKMLGQKVCALLTGGGYAQYATAPLATCLPVPRGLTLAEAAALPETFFTVWRNVFDLGHAQKGDWLLVTGGNSGIGTTAIMMGSAMGLNTIALVRGSAKAKLCKKIGAHHVIDVARQDMAKQVMAITKNRGVDVVLDMLGGENLAAHLTVMATGGRHVSIASLTGRVAALDIRAMMQKNLTLTGSTLRPQTVAVKGAIASALKKHIWPKMARGKLTPRIDCLFSLDAAQAAHDYLDSGQHTGKVVLIHS